MNNSAAKRQEVFEPLFICIPCGLHYGRSKDDGHIATFHRGQCSWCADNTDVTDPSVYGYPRVRK